MTGKSEKKFLFEVELNWLERDKGILTSKTAKGPIFVGLPPEFGGHEHPWSPEHLLIASVISCFMNTFQVFATKLRVQYSKFECTAIGQIELVDGKYRFTQIDLYPKILISGNDLLERAKQALDKAHQHCLVGNSICAHIIYHSQITAEQPVQQTEIVRA